MPDPIEQLDRAIAQTGRVVHGVRPDQLDLRTPCDEWDVRALLVHTVGVIERVTAAVTGVAPDPIDESSDLAAIVTAYDRAAAESARAWQEPGVLDRELQAAWGPTPGDRICRLNLADTVVHGWDVARATGRSTDDFDPELADAALAFMHEMMKPEFRGGPGFGPEVDVHAGAPVYDRLVAFAGRAP
jgi:uncharacterized protein (TIGR03086 family)